MSLSQYHLNKMAKAHSMGVTIPAETIAQWGNETMNDRMLRVHEMGAVVPSGTMIANQKLSEGVAKVA